MNLPTSVNPGRLPAFIFIGIVVLTGFLYYPSLDSHFILDDYYNLFELDQVESKGYLYYIFSGAAGPSGRPLSTFTFALQYADWPVNPFSFKSVNLLIHLVNGVLVFFITYILAGYIKCSRKESAFLACMVSGLWLIHPVHVNTVLYVVQRMTEISGFFVLTGISGYLWGRRYYENNNLRTGFTIMSLFVFLGTVLAVLGKENGILLPLFILVTEFTLLNDAKRERDWKIWAWIFLGIPLLALCLYFIWRWDSFMLSYEKRPFTLGDRLLTQAVVLFVYLRYLFLPLSESFSFYHDDFPISTGVFSPPYTALAVIGMLGMILLAMFRRKQFPVPSFVILWFFAGHVLESSFINLELFFEHRNYMPSVGICFLTGWLLVIAHRKIDSRAVLVILAATIVFYVSQVSAKVINLWSNPVKQAIEWTETRPDSPRAIDGMADIYLKFGENEKAREIYRKITRIYPKEIYPFIKDITISYCIENQRLPDEQWHELYNRAVNAKRYGYATIAEIDTLVDGMTSNQCIRTDIPKLMRMILVLASNPEYEFARGPLHEFLALLAIEINDGDTALANIRRSISEAPAAHRLVLELRLLLALGRVTEAEASLQRIQDYLLLHPREYLANRDIISELEAKLRIMKESG